MRQVLVRLGMAVSTAASVRRGVALLEQAADLLIADAQMAEEGLWNTVSQLEDRVRPRVIALVSQAVPRLIVQAAQWGAVEILAKPVDHIRLGQLAVHVLRPREAFAPDHGLTTSVTEFPLVAGSAAMHRVVRDVGRAASCELTVLLTGEAGTGKTHMARIIRRHSLRADSVYAEVESAGKPADRLLGELFGQPRAWAAAPAGRIGRIERCEGGTLVFESVDALPMQVQSHLLAVVQERVLRRTGSDQPISTNVRVLATSRADFERLVSAGRFRADLYHSLREFSIALPPLRDRLDDLPQLATWFLSRSTGQSTPPRATTIRRDAIEALQDYRWPGNLWELDSVLQAASWRCQGGVIAADDLPAPLRSSRPVATAGAQPPNNGMSAIDNYLRDAFTSDARKIHAEVVALFDRYICGRVLEHTGGNQSWAARILGMTRRSLRTKVRRFDGAQFTGRRRPQRRGRRGLT